FDEARQHPGCHSGYFSSDPDIKAGNIAYLSDQSFLQDGSAANADPMTAAHRNITASQFFLQRIKRMVAELIQKFDTIFLDRPISGGWMFGLYAVFVDKARFSIRND